MYHLYGSFLVTYWVWLIQHHSYHIPNLWNLCLYYSFLGKGKGKVHPCTGRTAHRGRGVSITPWPLFTPGKTWYPLYRRLGGPQGQSGQVRKISSPPGFDPWTVQPIAGCYTDYATWPTVIFRAYVIMSDCKSFTVSLDQYIANQNTKHRSWTQKNETLPPKQHNFPFFFARIYCTQFLSHCFTVLKSLSVNLIWTYLSSSVSGLKFISSMKTFSEMYLLILTTNRISHLWYSLWIQFSVHLFCKLQCSENRVLRRLF